MLRSLRALPHRTPFYYGWVIVACAVAAAFARQGSAVATLSVFVVPMTQEFGWSRGVISGAVSLGGVAGSLVAPLVGRFVDRYGSRLVLSVSAFVIGSAALALSRTTSTLGFYVPYVAARMMFAGPVEVAASTAVAHWFVRRRAQAMSFVVLGSGIGLATMPMVAGVAIGAWGWRTAWVVVALLVWGIGVAPAALLMLRRPEDVGLPTGAGRRRPPPSPPRRARDTAPGSASPPAPLGVGGQVRRPAPWRRGAPGRARPGGR